MLQGAPGPNVFHRRPSREQVNIVWCLLRMAPNGSIRLFLRHFSLFLLTNIEHQRFTSCTRNATSVPFCNGNCEQLGLTWMRAGNPAPPQAGPLPAEGICFARELGGALPG
jgi:hypothetical protein